MILRILLVLSLVFSNIYSIEVEPEPSESEKPSTEGGPGYESGTMVSHETGSDAPEPDEETQTGQKATEEKLSINELGEITISDIAVRANSANEAQKIINTIEDLSKNPSKNDLVVLSDLLIKMVDAGKKPGIAQDDIKEINDLKVKALDALVGFGTVDTFSSIMRNVVKEKPTYALELTDTLFTNSLTKRSNLIDAYSSAKQPDLSKFAAKIFEQATPVEAQIAKLGSQKQSIQKSDTSDEQKQSQLAVIDDQLSGLNEKLESIYKPLKLLLGETGDIGKIEDQVSSELAKAPFNIVALNSFSPDIISKMNSADQAKLKNMLATNKDLIADDVTWLANNLNMSNGNAVAKVFDTLNALMPLTGDALNLMGEIWWPVSQNADLRDFYFTAPQRAAFDNLAAVAIAFTPKAFDVKLPKDYPILQDLLSQKEGVLKDYVTQLESIPSAESAMAISQLFDNLEKLEPLTDKLNDIAANTLNVISSTPNFLNQFSDDQLTQLQNAAVLVQLSGRADGPAIAKALADYQKLKLETQLKKEMLSNPAKALMAYDPSKPIDAKTLVASFENLKNQNLSQAIDILFNIRLKSQADTNNPNVTALLSELLKTITGDEITKIAVIGSDKLNKLKATFWTTRELLPDFFEPALFDSLKTASSNKISWASIKASLADFISSFKVAAKVWWNTRKRLTDDERQELLQRYNQYQTFKKSFDETVLKDQDALKMYRAAIKDVDDTFNLMLGITK